MQRSGMLRPTSCNVSPVTRHIKITEVMRTPNPRLTQAHCWQPFSLKTLFDVFYSNILGHSRTPYIRLDRSHFLRPEFVQAVRK
jgi:hypothetical protein